MNAFPDSPAARPPDVSGSAVLRIDDLSVTFARRERDLPVVKHVSFEIGAAQTYGLVGESGCGKTTTALALMRYLAGNGRVDSGSITFDGEDMLVMSEDRLREVRGTKLGMVYQDPATSLNPSIRVGDQMTEVIRYHTGISKKDALERARGALERVAMPDPGGALRRYPFQLSGGQQQRVVIAMALSGDPRLLVLDEPTTGLDATVEAEVLDLIDDLRTRIDAAILLISHNLGMVARMCERVGVMYAGRIVEEGPARDLFTDPRHPYTMGLLRCVPRFGARKDTSTLVPIPGFLPRLGAPLPGCVFAARCELVQPECREREPDLFPWPGQTPDPALVDLDTLEGGAGSSRHARCYFAERVPVMREAAARAAAAAIAAAGEGETPKEVRETLEAVAAARSAAAAAAAERAAAKGAALDVDHVVKVFKDGRKRVIAVDDVSIEVGAGEILGLVGESGSGKTTLANCITGLYEADAGELRYAGAVLPDSVSKRGADTLRAIQMVFQNPDATLNPARTAGAILTRAVKRLGGLQGDAAQQPRRGAGRPGAGRGAAPRGPAGRAVGRPEAAHRHRPRLRRAAGPRGLRRAGLGPRRLGAGQHPQPARRAAGNRGRVVHLHLARPGGGALPLRPHRRHVPGQAHGAGRRRRGLHATAPPLHRGPDVGHPDARLRAPVAAHRAARTGAEPERAADRLPLSHSLPPLPGRHLRRADAALARGRARPQLPVSHRARRAARAAARRAYPRVAYDAPASTAPSAPRRGR